jgi:hypothetical protein
MDNSSASDFLFFLFMLFSDHYCVGYCGSLLRGDEISSPSAARLGGFERPYRRYTVRSRNNCARAV